MSQEPWMLVVSFDPSDPDIYRNLHDCLQELTQKSEDKLDTIMANGRFIVKRRAHPREDQKLADRLKAAGATCHFVRPKTNNTLSENKDQISAELVCPRCSHRQPPSLECRSCGVIFAKAKSRHADPKPPDPALEQTKADLPATQPPTPIMKSIINKIIMLPQLMRGDPKNHQEGQPWLQKLSDALVNCLVISAITLVLEIGLLLLAKYLWFIYSWTPLGQTFNQMHPTMAAMFQEVLHANLAQQAGQACLIAGAAAFAFGIVGRITHINRFIFDCLGFLSRAIAWVLPVTALTAWAAWLQGVWSDYAVCFGLLLAPMLCLSGRCIELINLIIPEAGSISDAMANLAKVRHKQLAEFKSYLLGWFNRWGR